MIDSRAIKRGEVAQDDWKRLRDGSLKPEHFTLRRVHKH